MNSRLSRYPDLTLSLLGCLIGFLLSVQTRASEEVARPVSQETAATNSGSGNIADPIWADKVKKFFERDYLLGDWGGLRSGLSKRGVDFEFFYAGAVPSNLSGGLKEGSVYEGALLMTLDLDSQRLAGYEGGHFHVGSLWLHSGPSFSQHYVGDLNVVSLLDFRDSQRLWELWYQQKLLDDRLTLKAGQMAIDRDFIVPELTGTLGTMTFLNQTFLFPTMAFNVYDVAGFPRGFHGLASTPYGAPGFLVKGELSSRAYLQAAVYDGNPDTSYSGTRVNLNEQEGALAYFESGLRWSQEKADTGLPGVCKVGGYYHTDEFYDVYAGAADAINRAIGLPAQDVPAHSGNYGMYLLTEQTLYRERARDPAQQGLVGFFRLGFAPPDRNLAQLGVDGGIVYKGAIPGRDYDTIGVAASYLKISDKIRSAIRDANDSYGLGLALPDAETVIEISYKAQLAAWWTLQPSLQWVIHPGGRANGQPTPDALVLIALMSLRL